jgi:hypothetical protein
MTMTAITPLRPMRASITGGCAAEVVSMIRSTFLVTARGRARS